MDALHSPTPGLGGFQIPDAYASREEWERAFEVLRSVKLTWPQIATGFRNSAAADGRLGDVRRLRAWCEEQGLVPADVTAEAILVRMSPLMENLFENPDFDATAQERMALRDLVVEEDVLHFALGGSGYPEAGSIA